MSIQINPKSVQNETHADDITLTLVEIVTALIPVLIGMAVVGLIAILMVM